MMTGMSDFNPDPVATLNRPDPDASEREQCEALLIALASRRYVIIRRDGPIRLWSADQLCRPVRHFRVGESVYYDGKPDRVRAIGIY